MSNRTNTLRLARARGDSARPFTGTALDVTLCTCDRDVPEQPTRTTCPVSFRLTYLHRYAVR